MNNNRSIRVSFISVAIALLSLSVFSQFTPVPHAYTTDPTEHDWNVSISLNPTAQDDVVSVIVLDKSTATKVPYVSIVYFDAGHTGKKTGFRLISVPLTTGSSYELLISVILRKADGKFDKIDTQSYDFSPKSPTALSSGASKAEPNQPVKSKAKTDSDFYFSGDLTKVSSEKTAFTTEIKIEPVFGPRKWRYSPFFHLNASTDPEADPDAMDFGIKNIRTLPLKKRPKPGEPASIRFTLGGKIESQKDFKNTNLIFDPTGQLNLTPFRLAPKSFLVFRPFAGVEIGKNLKSPLTAAQGAGIARVVGGINAQMDIPLKAGIQGITFSADWTRRWLLKRELSYKVNDDKTLSLVEFGKSPRDFVEGRFDFAVNDFLSPYIAYDWGQVPPSYKLQDHRLRVGLTYKFKLSKSDP